MKKLLTTIIITALILVSTVGAFASDEERGALEINVNVIHDTREVTGQQHRAIGNELAPNLFLSEKTEFENSRRQNYREHLLLVQEQLFLDTTINTRVSDFSTEIVIDRLFAEGSFETSRITTLPQYLETVNIPSWITILLVIIGLCLLSGLGIVVGKWISPILHGKKSAAQTGQL